MAALVVRVSDLASLPVPEICARTGRRATRRAKVTVTKLPWWAYASLILGIVPFLVIALLTQRKVILYLPHARGRAFRQRLFFYLAVLVGLAFPVFVLAAYFEPTTFAYGGLAVTASAFAGCVSAYRGSMVRGRWVDLDTVKLLNLDPTFAAALTEGLAHRHAPLAAGPPPGWYPDPSGQHTVRWFDGANWTAHVDGIAVRTAYG